MGQVLCQFLMLGGLDDPQNNPHPFLCLVHEATYDFLSLMSPSLLVTSRTFGPGHNHVTGPVSMAGSIHHDHISYIPEGHLLKLSTRLVARSGRSADRPASAIFHIRRRRSLAPQILDTPNLVSHSSASIELSNKPKLSSVRSVGREWRSKML